MAPILRANLNQPRRDSGIPHESASGAFGINQSVDHNRILVFAESWASEDAWRAHMQGAAIKRFQMNGGPDLIADFQLHRLTPVADGRSDKAA
jgi:quinol monooxygenase YgiN